MYSNIEKNILFFISLFTSSFLAKRLSLIYQIKLFCLFIFFFYFRAIMANNSHRSPCIHLMKQPAFNPDYRPSPSPGPIHYQDTLIGTPLLAYSPPAIDMPPELYTPNQFHHFHPTTPVNISTPRHSISTRRYLKLE